jgi:hypothetical protein
LIEWRAARGRPVTVGNRTITPVARFLVVRWPWGRSSWSGPAAVIVEGEGEAERIPVANVNAWILGALRVGAIAVIVAAIIKGRRRGDSDDRGT